jgi:predicted Rossmann-fold nucleotide-binding protein
MESVTWAQLGLHGKPIGIVNVAGYFDELLAFVEGARRAGFIPAAHGEILIVRDDAAALVEAIA